MNQAAIDGFPKSQELKQLIRVHVDDVATKVLAIIGEGLKSLQWCGFVTFNELCYAEGSEQALIVSRLNEKNIRTAVTNVQDCLDRFGYDYEFDVVKLPENPFFRIEYRVALGDESEDSETESCQQETLSGDLYSEMFDLSISGECCSEVGNSVSDMD